MVWGDPPVPQGNDVTRVPLLPGPFFLHMSATPDADLHHRQQEAVRMLPQYVSGATNAAKPKDKKRNVGEWSVISSAEGKSRPGQYGPEHLSNLYKLLSLGRDCGVCALCHTELCAAEVLVTKELVFPLQGTKPESKDFDAAWMRDLELDPYFRKDNPSNVLTLCVRHRDCYKLRAFCLTPSLPDLQALIEFEMENMNRRQHGACPYRLVPVTRSLSGWYEYLPLNKLAQNLEIGPYKTKIIGSEAQGFEVFYHSTLIASEPSVPTCHYDTEERAMLIWLGLSDVSPQALVRGALNALNACKHRLPPRHQVVLKKLRELEQLYYQVVPTPLMASAAALLAFPNSGLTDYEPWNNESHDLGGNVLAIPPSNGQPAVLNAGPSFVGTSTAPGPSINMPKPVAANAASLETAAGTVAVPGSTSTTPADQTDAASAIQWGTVALSVQNSGRDKAPQGAAELLPAVQFDSLDSQIQLFLTAAQMPRRSLPSADSAAEGSQRTPAHSGAGDGPWAHPASAMDPSASGAGQSTGVGPPAASDPGPSMPATESIPYVPSNAAIFSPLFFWIEDAHVLAEARRIELDEAIAIYMRNKKRASEVMDVENIGEGNDDARGEDPKRRKIDKGKQRA